MPTSPKAWHVPAAGEFRRFLSISLGSLADLSHFLELAEALGFLRPDVFVRLERLRTETSKLTWRLYQALGDDPK